MNVVGYRDPSSTVNNMDSIRLLFSLLLFWTTKFVKRARIEDVIDQECSTTKKFGWSTLRLLQMSSSKEKKMARNKKNSRGSLDFS